MKIDDRISEALLEVPTAPQRPLADIEARGRARKRRRAGAAATGVVVAVALGIPAVASLDRFNDTTAGPADADAVTLTCTEAFLSLENVPDEMRVLWDTSEFLEPREASMVDPIDVRSCYGYTPSELFSAGYVEVLQETDDAARGMRVMLVPEPISQPESVETRTLDSAVGPITAMGDGLGAVSASWPATDGEGYWNVDVFGDISDSELIELAESARLDDGAVDLSQWAGLDDAARVRSGGPAEMPPGWGRSGVHRYQVATGNLRLTVEPGHTESSLWDPTILSGSTVGDVMINGNPGFLSGDDTLRWLTDEGLLFSISSQASYTPERLIELAESVTPVPADDPRLIEIWTTGLDR